MRFGDEFSWQFYPLAAQLKEKVAEKNDLVAKFQGKLRRKLILLHIVTIKLRRIIIVLANSTANCAEK
ncbi:MAG: hypothetical protein IPK01_02710 [Acidobacteria bacterium]|nr:hypothetical protein [Acidobacteriota bacterium]